MTSETAVTVVISKNSRQKTWKTGKI